ncbi:hypothetical protein KTO58_08700 [Chitinophaga pendula]|uniref:two-component regulator propeller domain-containing protein n=2 Tax=Chitinophaga TaxID=79328 RepID=UPI0012FDCAE8|nr:hypothetical protein KTO58_08700 [Chitinophaga pendula]
MSEKYSCHIFIPCILLSLLVLCYTYAIAQRYNCTQYKTENGLTNNIVYSVEQDKEGLLWFGTEKDEYGVYLSNIQYSGKMYHTQNESLLRKLKFTSIIRSI